MSRILQQWCDLVCTRVSNDGTGAGVACYLEPLPLHWDSAAQPSAAQCSAAQRGLTSSSRRMLSCTISTMAGRGKGRRRGH